MGSRQILLYATADGSEPYTEWLNRLKDRAAALRIEARIGRIEDGNFGDCKSVGDGVFELRLNFGPGCRVYFGQQGSRLVILLCGGDKSTQQRDIADAKAFWADWLRNPPQE